MSRHRKPAEFRVPFNRACFADAEFDYIRTAVSEGQVAGEGPFTKRCQDLLEKELGATKAPLTTSCTDAQEMAAMPSPR
ncbi:MAG: hypothetical protein WAT58_05010 [Candidatus Dormiibacterota bacterium]